MKTLRQIQQMITSINDWEMPLRQGVLYLLKGCFIRLFHSSRLNNAQKTPFELLNTNSRQVSYLIFEKTLKPAAIGLLADNCIYLIIRMDVFFILRGD